jgi:16S rRNA (cytosine967-C5)-methyltransferase
MTAPGRTAAVSPARAVAYAVLRRVFEQDAWTDRALHGEARRADMDARDRALATQLAYGAVQRVATLDHVIATLAKRPVAKIQPPLLAALRLGVFQLSFLDGVAAHAAVGESVELAKADAPRGAGLVNAVLRRAAREGRALVEALPEGTAAEAALRHSYPVWIAALWFDALGAGDARALMAAGNRPAEAALRANALRTSAEALAAALPVPSRPAGGLPEGLVLEGAFDAFGSPQWEQGLFMPQSRAAMAVGRILAPRPGERVLDLCAAPGGKTTHLAALMEGRGAVVAVERRPGRAQALARTAARMGADGVVEVRTGDAAEPQEAAAYDRVLVDPPCSDLGTLAARPDARWRKQAADPGSLAQLQGAILRAGAQALRPGGTLVYSTCTISPEENEGVVERFLAEHGEFAAEDLGASEWSLWQHGRRPMFLQTLPHRDGTDGFFVARLRRSEAA